MQRANTRPLIAIAMIPPYIGTLNHTTRVLVTLDLKFDNHRSDKKQSNGELISCG